MRTRIFKVQLAALASLVAATLATPGSAAPATGGLAPTIGPAQKPGTEQVVYYRYRYHPYFWNHHWWRHRVWRYHRWYYY